VSSEFARFTVEPKRVAAIPLGPPSVTEQVESATADIGTAKGNGRSASPLTVDLRLLESTRRQRVKINFRQAIRFCEAVVDVLTITFAIVLGYVACHYTALGKHVYYSSHALIGVALGCALVMVLMLDRAGAYAPCNSLLRVRETEQILRASAQTALIALAASFTSTVMFSRWLLVLCVVVVPLVLFVQKTLVYLLIHAFHDRGYGIERALIYGAGCTGRRVFSALKRSPRLGLDPVLFVDDDRAKIGGTVFEMGYERKRSAPVVGGPVTTELLKQHHIDLVIVTASLDSERFLQTVETAFTGSARVSYVPSHFLSSDALFNYHDVDGVLLASFGKPPRRLAREVTKRLVDLVGSLVFMIVGSPVFLLLSVILKLDSPGPILFKQQRVGLGGRVFEMYKFRTMHVEAPAYDFSPRHSMDPRITRFGRFLRKTSLDEVPQLLNVIEGSMSLVGPRPEMPFIVAKYTQNDSQRLQVKPGLTGLWQLSGDRAFLIHENLEYDLYYIQHRNFFMDLAIMLHTSIFAMRGI